MCPYSSSIIHTCPGKLAQEAFLCMLTNNSSTDQITGGQEIAPDHQEMGQPCAESIVHPQLQFFHRQAASDIEIWLAYPTRLWKFEDFTTVRAKNIADKLAVIEYSHPRSHVCSIEVWVPPHNVVNWSRGPSHVQDRSVVRKGISALLKQSWEHHPQNWQVSWTWVNKLYLYHMPNTAPGFCREYRCHDLNKSAHQKRWWKLESH